MIYDHSKLYHVCIIFLLLINLTIKENLPSETINLFSNLYFIFFLFIIILYIAYHYYLIGLLLIINIMTIIFYSILNKLKIKIKV